MKIVSIAGASKEPFSSPLFTGSDVTIQTLAPDSADFNVNVVNFAKGVRNKFHSHDSDQVLIVTAGKGIVATENEEWEVIEGDVIFVPGGEKHWHGATEESDFSHIYVTGKKAETTQLED